MPTSRSATAKRARRALVVIGLAVVLQACAVEPSPDPRFDLNVDNGTTVPISILLNGHPVREVDPGTSALVALQGEPPGVVSVEARLPDGRPAITFAIDPRTLSSVAAGSAVDVTGAAHRVDLSCGRLDLWLLAPPLGPAPGPGTPGDCGLAPASAGAS